MFFQPQRRHQNSRPAPCVTFPNVRSPFQADMDCIVRLESPTYEGNRSSGPVGLVWLANVSR